MSKLTPHLRACLLALGLLFGWTSASPATAGEVGEQVLGDPQAPVTMVEFASLTCPHCASFHTDTLPALKERYIDTGKVKLVMRDFPLDQLALAASVIAHCAGPDRYFAFIEAMFANQQSWARAADPVQALLQLAQVGGLAQDQARACLDDKSMADAVLQMRLDAQEQYDIKSTPSFVIDGTLYAGNRSVEEFGEIIEEATP
ncbi:MAG: DsbA family protein [Geminicoccaceae bacterium]|nr:DsbA family protein [Geminicoccaceae bacterium]